MLKNSTARDVAIVLVIKTAIVLAAAIFVFGPSARPRVDSASVSALIVSDLPAKAPVGNADHD